MGCICSCHDRMSAFAIRGCCWECEKEHDPLRNALLQADASEHERDRWKAMHAAASDKLAIADLQNGQMRDVVDAACAYESILNFDDLNSAYRGRREVTDAFVKAVGAYKTRLPEKRSCVGGCRCKGKCEYALTGGAKVCAVCGCINQTFP